MKNNLGYACLNTVLSKKGITTNRGMIKRTFIEKGLSYASELALQNVKDLEKVFTWNVQNGITFFRISSDIFPWMSEYNLNELKDYEQIKKILNRAGSYAIRNGLRFGFHPGPFNILCSPNETVVLNTINELSKHAEILDLLGADQTPYYKINIHIGGAYGDKKSSLDRFCQNFMLLPDNVKRRLTIENDDKKNMYTVEDLLPVSKLLGIPLVFDYHHWDCNNGNLELETALRLSLETWGNIKPVVHYSSSRKLYEDTTAKEVSHADWIYNEIPTFGLRFDIMLECKQKEQALLKYRKEFLNKIEKPCLQS